MIPERESYRGDSYKLFDDYNDVHIFVEDSGFENLYKILFKKYGIRIENIFSKNGKESIIKAADSCSDPKCVYIIDRDWDDLFNTMHSKDNIVILELNSIESYLINREAFSGIVLSEKPKCELDSLFSDELYTEIITNVSNSLRPLFECLATMQMGSERKKGCSNKPGYFQQKNKSCAIDNKMVESFISDSGVAPPDSVKEYFSEVHLIRRGHGKYMLHYIWNSIQYKTKIRVIGMEKLMIRLAQLVDTTELSSLANKIKTMASPS